MKQLMAVFLVGFLVSTLHAQADCRTYADCAERGSALFQQDKYDSALVYLDKAISIWKDADGKPQLANGYVERGRVHTRLAVNKKDDNEWQKALENYTKAIELAPDKYFAYVAIAYYYQQKNEHELALTFYDKAVEVEPNNARPYFERGWRHHYNSQKWEEAIADFSKAISFITPQSYDEATKTFKMTVVDKTIPARDRALYYYYRARSYSSRNSGGDTQKALDDLNQAIKEDGSDGVFYYQRGYLFYINQKDQAAFNDFSQAINLKPDLAGAYRWRGQILYNNQQHDAALSDFLKAGDLRPDEYADGYVWASTVYLILGKIDPAIQYANKALQYPLWKGDKANAYYNRGYAYWHKQQTDQTIADFKKAVDLGHSQAREYLKNSFKINY